MENPVEMIRRGIAAANLSPASVAKADAAITRSIGREVARALEVVKAGQVGSNAYQPNGPVTHEQRLLAAQATTRWEGLARDAESTIATAIAATESYEAAAQLIEQSVEGL